jgi:hypothetical protein
MLTVCAKNEAHAPTDSEYRGPSSIRESSKFEHMIFDSKLVVRPGIGNTARLLLTSMATAATPQTSRYFSRAIVRHNSNLNHERT